MRISPAGAEGNSFPLNGAAPQSRLVAAAHEFEAQMMKELLKPLQQDGLGWGGSDGEGGSSGIFGDFAAEALGSALSQQGGLGSANRILKDLAGAQAKVAPDSSEGGEGVHRPPGDG